VAVAHVDPAKVDLAKELRRRYPPERGSLSGVGRVVETGQPLLVADVTDDMLVQSARDAEHLRILREVGMRSAILLPLTIRDQTVGVLGLFQAESRRRYAADDLTFGDELAHKAAAAIENARLYDQARRAIGVRDQFLSIASHELRTPLTSLILQLSSVSRLVAGGTFAGTPAGEKLEKWIARMERQAARVTTLVDELLNVSRIATGRLALNPQSTDVVELVREVVERLAEEAQRARSPITLQAPDSVSCTCDRNRVDQVVTNLVVNAVKYASGKPIHVEVAAGDALVRVVVRDEGPGISEMDQARIFGQFERAAPPAATGFGLGLWIAKSIVEAHGGRIDVASRPGQGATFTVELPAKPPS
jgi:signal transduction histidine kinase